MRRFRSWALTAATGLLALTAGVADAAAVTPEAGAGHSAASGAQQVIVRSATPDLALLRRTVHRLGGHVERSLWLIHGVAATVPAAAVDALRATPGVAEVSTDAAVQLAGLGGSLLGGYAPSDDPYSMYRLEQDVNARAMWRNGYTGRGVDIALIDSGVSRVAGLAGPNVIAGPDLSGDKLRTGADTDLFGHGTHLAGIIAGHDTGVSDVTAAAGDTSHFLGVAPDARIVSVKVADSEGNSDLAQVIAAIGWVVRHAHDNGLNIRVLNLSFGTDSTQPYTLDPLTFAAEQAWKAGIVVVTSAGNAGSTLGRLSDPADDPYVIAVGADDPNGTISTDDDAVPSFSSVGDGVRNPDLVAPGVHVQSLIDPASYISNLYAVTGAINDRYFRGSGTSQAAAFVSGAAALILQQQPDLTPDQVKYVLVHNATSLPSASSRAQGAGLLWLQPDLGRVPAATQSFAPATGAGTFAGARGTSRARENGADASSSSWASSSWASGRWASSSWASSYWASSYWASSSWASSSWASSSWASSYWASSSWASSSWASSYWASSSWASCLWQ